MERRWTGRGRDGRGGKTLGQTGNDDDDAMLAGFVPVKV